MSRSGSSERIVFLRRRIAALEAGGEPPPARAGGDGLSRLFDPSRGGLGEALPARPTDAAAAAGFAFALALRRLRLRPQGAVVWIAEDMAARELGLPYGRGLQAAGLPPELLVLARTRRPRETLWAMEEALRSGAAVVLAESWAEASAYDLTASRRLALAARRSGNFGLLLLPRAAGAAQRLASAAETRVEIAACAPPPRAEGAPRPLPGPPAFRLRVVKARGLIGAFDPQAWRDIAWSDIVFDHEEAEFHGAPFHALPFHVLPGRVPAAPSDRPADAPAAGKRRALA
jgi:protein ImuA